MTAHHHEDEMIEKLGIRWFFGAGVFALLLITFLVTTDHRLSTSNKEEVLRKTLHELRSAQSGLHTGEADPRELRSTAAASAGLVAVPAAETAHAEGAH